MPSNSLRQTLQSRGQAVNGLVLTLHIFGKITEGWEGTFQGPGKAVNTWALTRNDLATTFKAAQHIVHGPEKSVNGPYGTFHPFLGSLNNPMESLEGLPAFSAPDLGMIR